MNIMLVLLGAGTANYHILAQLAHSSQLARLIRHIVICDRATIRVENAITCPLYRGHVHEPKCSRLGALAVRRFGVAKPLISTIHRRVEEVSWDDVLAPGSVRHRRMIFVLIGLDNWQSRLTAMEDLRRHTVTHPDHRDTLVFIQVGLDLSQASIAVLGASYDDPCPACGKHGLPEPQPCVARTQERRLLRGNLRCEARAAGRCVRRIVEDLALRTPRSTWLNTKTNLVADPGARIFRQFTRSCQYQVQCLGPHNSAGPLRWEPILSERKEG